MKITMICSVRGGVDSGIEDYVRAQENRGNTVYFPPRDTPQNDPIGLDICQRMRVAIEQADEVHIWYNKDSQGSHFDLGMAFALRKKWKLVNNPEDSAEKSYLKVIKVLT